MERSLHRKPVCVITRFKTSTKNFRLPASLRLAHDELVHIFHFAVARLYRPRCPAGRHAACQVDRGAACRSRCRAAPSCRRPRWSGGSPMAEFVWSNRAHRRLRRGRPRSSVETGLSAAADASRCSLRFCAITPPPCSRNAAPTSTALRMARQDLRAAIDSRTRVGVQFGLVHFRKPRARVLLHVALELVDFRGLGSARPRRLDHAQLVAGTLDFNRTHARRLELVLQTARCAA